MFLCLFLFALWLILNGRITWEVCAFGVVIVAGVYLFCRKVLKYERRPDAGPLRHPGGCLCYTFLLIWEILLANLHVMRIILTPKPHYEPAIVRIHVPLKTELSRVFLANSITLTPGTVTIDQQGEDFIVLCLDKSGGAAIADWSLVKILRKLEGSSHD